MGMEPPSGLCPCTRDPRIPCPNAQARSHARMDSSHCPSHGQEQREGHAALRTSSLRAGHGGRCSQKCVGRGSALMCLRSFWVCSRAGDRTRRDCALDGPLFELLPGPCKPITFPKSHPCLNWFTCSLSLLNCKPLRCRSHLSYVSMFLVPTQWLGFWGAQ